MILEGARQVGKTWLMKEFARTHYAHAVYVRFDKDLLLRRIFDVDFDIERIVHELEIAKHTKVVPEKTVLLFDEIQACKNALTSLKYFQEDRPDLHVIAAGSLLGLEYRDGREDGGEPLSDTDRTTGFPVGKVDTVKVFPLTFREYLSATGEEALAEEIEKENWPLLADFHGRLSDCLRHYYVIGGMPAVVAAYVEDKDFREVRRLQRGILADYRRDFAKHAPKGDVRKIEMVWDSIPSQLAKENKKFMYGGVKPHGRASEFRDPLAWLTGAGLVCQSFRAKVPRLPLNAYQDGAFKLFLLDVGLLAAMSNLDPAAILDAPRVFSEFKGALTEQYVCQQLLAESDSPPHYWSTDDSQTEVDFLLQRGAHVVPLEVKAEKNVNSSSLRHYVRKFAPPLALRGSMLDYRRQPEGASELVNLPLYAIDRVCGEIAGERERVLAHAYGVASQPSLRTLRVLRRISCPYRADGGRGTHPA